MTIAGLEIASSVVFLRELGGSYLEKRHLHRLHRETVYHIQFDIMDSQSDREVQSKPAVTQMRSLRRSAEPSQATCSRQFRNINTTNTFKFIGQDCSHNRQHAMKPRAKTESARATLPNDELEEIRPKFLASLTHRTNWKPD